MNLWSFCRRNALPKIVFGLALVLPLSPPANADTERITRTVPLEPGGTLRLTSFSGRVNITVSDRPEVVIDARRHASRERLSRVKLQINSDGSTVTVTANHQEGRNNPRQDNVVETEFDIRVPRRTNLDLDVFSGSVEIRDVEGAQGSGVLRSD